MNKYNIIIEHKDWKGNCVIDNNNYIFRKEIQDEHGTYFFQKNKMLVKWDKWGDEVFYCYDDHKNFYDIDIYKKKCEDIYIFDKRDILFIILNKELLKFRIWGKNIFGKYKIYNDQSKIVLEYNNGIKMFKKVNDYLYYDEEYFFTINLNKNYRSDLYIFNKITNKYYNSLNIDNGGDWKIDNNNLILNYIDSNNNMVTQKFISNNYYEIDDNNIQNSNRQLTVIKPHKIMINDRVLFSNITLCKNKIILTSIHYRDTPWFIDDINIYVNERTILNREVYDNDNFESSFNIILELDMIVDNVVLFINYQNRKQFKINLEQFNIPETNISAMTLFKEDYELLRRYIKYYYNMGVEVFILYYNGSLTNELIKY